MKLVIFPGSASPAQPLYRKVYGLLQSRAPEFGYTGVNTSVRWPGHLTTAGGSNGRLTLDAAVAVAVHEIHKCEHAGDPYHILARSFGNYVAVKAILEAKPRLLRKLLSWAPPPYWILWRMFVRDYDETQQIAHEKWLAFDSTFFPSVIPLETMLPHLNVECVAATGSKDKYCRHEHLAYLSNFASKSGFVVCDEVLGATHEVHEGLGDSVVNTYLEALLSTRPAIAVQS